MDIILSKLESLEINLKQLVEKRSNSEIELLTVKEVQKILKISRNSFNRLKDEGILKVYSLRGKLYCKRSEILQTIENCRIN